MIVREKVQGASTSSSESCKQISRMSSVGYGYTVEVLYLDSHYYQLISLLGRSRNFLQSETKCSILKFSAGIVNWKGLWMTILLMAIQWMTVSVNLLCWKILRRILMRLQSCIGTIL